MDQSQQQEFAPQELRLLEDLFCKTPLAVEELIYTPEMDAIHDRYVRSSGKAVTIRSVFLALRDLDRVGRLAGKSRCLKCSFLRPTVVAYLCPSCFRKINGIPDPPQASSCGVALGICGVQVEWHLRRMDDASPWLEDIIRLIEECQPNSQ